MKGMTSRSGAHAMPGMSTHLSTNNPTIVSAFHTALFHQALIVLVLLALVFLAWNVIRTLAYRSALENAERWTEPEASATGTTSGEPLGRRVLRIGFALLWLLDGLLQVQASMPLGMVPGSIDPAAAGSPSWLRHLVVAGTTIWNDHPVTAASAAVWIQVGIGLFLLLAPRGLWSRLAGGASIAWGLLVWVFGESLGGILAPGSSWLFGTPGAVVFYCLGGLLIAFPERWWSSERLGRAALAALGLFFLGMTALQAWPGNNFWTAGRDDALAGMTSGMATTPQPHFLASLVADFSSFDAAHAVAVNAVVVVVLGLVGLAFLSRRPALVRPAVVAIVILSLADWVLVQDFGFFGGVGTDPNSMIPLVVLVVASYCALTRPVPLERPAVEPETGLRFIESLRLEAATRPSYLFRAVAAVGALAVVLLGAVPMAVASVNPHADVILSEAIDGPLTPVDAPAPSLRLTDQEGKIVTLSSLRGKVVVLTFLDPVCTSDCPLIAQEMRETDEGLGSFHRHVVFGAVVANPIYRAVSDTRAFDAAEGMNRLPNWLYMTGSVAALEHTWKVFGLQVDVEPAGAMIAHTDLAYVIDPRGRIRYEIDSDPGPGSQASKASFSSLLDDAINDAWSKR